MIARVERDGLLKENIRQLAKEDFEKKFEIRKNKSNNKYLNS